ncbi:MAG: hypothetical protein KZQ83_20155 [gamma proteobacterium symbiont of Taylorina sp.]|nr:hypothetical protein [gamma proteobacterium symbiont of Taylorina sp.]
MNKVNKKLGMVEEAYKVGKQHISMAFYHCILNDGGCSCGEGKNCNTPGDHPIISNPSAADPKLPVRKY